MSSVEQNPEINPVDSSDWINRQGWPAFAEKVLNDWRMTLRLALLLVIAIGAASVAVWVLGIA